MFVFLYLLFFPHVVYSIYFGFLAFRIAANNYSAWNIPQGMTAVVHLIEKENVDVIFGQRMSTGR